MWAVDEYNYAVFPPEDDVEVFAHFPEHLKAGDQAPDPTVTDLESGELFPLSHITQRGLTVIEFGSLT